MYRRLYLTVAALLATSIGVTAQALRPPGPDDEAIVLVLNQQVEAWNKADVDGFMMGYWQSDSLVFITAHGPVYGWQEALDHYKRAYPGQAAMGHLTFDHLLLSPLGGDGYFVAGQWHIQRAAGDIGGQFTLLFRKIDGHWRIVVDHTN